MVITTVSNAASEAVSERVKLLQRTRNGARQAQQQAGISNTGRHRRQGGRAKQAEQSRAAGRPSRQAVGRRGKGMSQATGTLAGGRLARGGAASSGSVTSFTCKQWRWSRWW